MTARLDVFDIKDIQHAIAIMEEFGQAGVTDPEVMKSQLRSKVQEYTAAIDQAVKEREEAAMQTEQVRAASLPYPDGCPDCGSKRTKYTIVDGEMVVTCVDCRWSAYIGAAREGR